MISIAIVATSVVLQFTAAALAFRLGKVTSHRGWGLIAFAMALMGVRRGISLSHALASDSAVPLSLSAELVALSISLLLVAGVAMIHPLFSAAARARESEEKASQMEERFYDAIENIPEAFVLFDRDKRLVYCNTRFKDFYAYSNKDASPGAEVADLARLDVERGTIVANSDFERERHIRRREGDIPNFRQYDLLLRDGRWLECRDFKTNDGGIISVHSDVTERKLADEELRRVRDDLEIRVQERTRDAEHARHEAERASRIKSLFLANLSHELRTPLNAVLGFADVMRRGLFGPVENARYQEYLESIYESGGHLRELIDDVLDISALDEGRLELQEEIVNVADLVSKSIKDLRPKAEARKVRIVEEVADKLPGFFCDRYRLRQIIINLVSNAIKYSKEGSSGKVVITARQTGRGDLVLSIADDGIGMKPDYIKSALDPFGKIHEVTPRERGIGLGLPLTKRLVQLHGGRFDVESEYGKGTVVTMTFPPSRMHTNGEKTKV